MKSVILPDGGKLSFESIISGEEIANSISKSLAKKAVAITLNGTLHDLNTIIDEDGTKVSIITTNDDIGLEIIRHDAAHLLAHAVKELYGDEVQVTIGPVIKDGFFYDFATDHTFSESDIEKIEKHMHKIRSRSDKIVRKVMSKSEATEHFKSIGEHFKVKIIEEIPDDEAISIYFQGDFSDLCRGPHSPSTDKIKAFKLLKVSGSYWKGDSQGEKLQRIYGTAWANKEDLETYLKQLEEAEKRDHRKLGKAMNLFHFQPEAPGSVFWHAKGWKTFLCLMDYMRKKNEAAGYQEINTPDMMDSVLWQKSGHLENYGESMFMTQTRDEKRTMALKPMSCPGALQVFNNDVVSYRSLPMLLSEFGKVHRYEASGAMHGMLRLRSFTQDDAHVFCTQAQIEEECTKLCNFILEVYKDFGFEDVRIKFSDRPEKRVGSDAVWDKAETALKNVLERIGVEYTINQGEGAFYGPKLEFVLCDAIGRDWQLGTIQLDFNLTGRLDSYYTDQDGKKYHPILIHRAIFGALERFFGIMIEHYGGVLPLWIAPVQAVVATITDAVSDYAKEVADMLKENGMRVELDDENQKISYKVREHSLAKVPMILVIGQKEKDERMVTIRKIGTDKTETMALSDFVAFANGVI